MNDQHHRSTFGHAVREALAVLDRASEGQPVPKAEIDRALRVTGDTGWKRDVWEPRWFDYALADHARARAFAQPEGAT